MSLFSRDYIKMEIDYLKYRQCFNLLKCVQYLLSAWFLDGRTSTLVIASIYRNLIVRDNLSLVLFYLSYNYVNDINSVIHHYIIDSDKLPFV